LDNFNKDSCRIKFLYGSAGRGYGVEEEFVWLLMVMNTSLSR